MKLTLGFYSLSMSYAESLIHNAHILPFLRVILGLILLTASVTKLGDFRKCTEIVSAYELLPERTVTTTSFFILLTECFVGGCLFIGLLLPWAAFAAAGIFITFTGAVAINLLLGRNEIACGCFGSSSEQRLTWFIVIRNLVLTACAFVLALAQLDHPFWIFPSQMKGTFSVTETFAITSLAVA